MNKLKLNVDELVVESFHSTSAEDERSGTVRGNADSVELCTWDDFCTAFGTPCGTTAPPGEICACLKHEPCATEAVSGCQPTHFC
jgi:hypothetical protein